LKHAVLAALVAFGLFSLLVGIRTDTGPGGALELTARFETLAVFVAVAFAGVFLREILFSGATLDVSSFVPESVRRSTARIAQFLGPGLLVFAAVVPVIFYNNRYLLDLSIQILTYVMLGWGLNIVVGLAGLLDLGYVAFYAVGAYSYALLAQNFGLSFWICLPLAGILAAFWGILLGFPVLRLRGDYLAIVTLAFGEIIRLVLINWQSLTGGPNGISSIPRPSFFGLPFNSEEGGFAHTFGLEFSPTHRVVFLYYVILALALLTNAVTIRLRGFRSAERGRPCVRTKSPAARSASTPPTPSSRHLRWALCSEALPVRSSPRDRDSSARNLSYFRNRQWSSRLSSWVAWARRSALPLPPP
jgi:branched-chain amino acid transport system permease protein